MCGKQKKLAFSSTGDSLAGGGLVFLTLADARSEPGAKESHSFPLYNQGWIKNSFLGIKKNPHPLRVSYNSLFRNCHVEEDLNLAKAGIFIQDLLALKVKQLRTGFLEGVHQLQWAFSPKKAS